jgi:hypothetical protein
MPVMVLFIRRVVIGYSIEKSSKGKISMYIFTSLNI